MNGSSDDEITFLDLVKILIHYKYVTLVVFLLVIGCGIAFSVLSTPVYRAEVIFAEADQQSSMGGASASILSRFGGLAGLGGLGRQDKTEQGVATLKSQQFTREFIQAKNLLPILYADRWNAEKSEWIVESPEEIPKLADAHLLFDSIRIIEEEDRSGLITLAIEWTDPVVATEWANDLIMRLNDKLRMQAIEEANETIDFLNKEVEKTRIVQLQQAIYFMLEEQINVRTLANIRKEFAFKVISPAIAPELDRYVSPNRPLILILSAVLGAFLGMLMSCLIYGIQRLRAELKAA